MAINTTSLNTYYVAMVGAASASLAIELNDNKITRTEYAQALVNVIQNALVQALEFLQNIDLTNAKSKLIESQTLLREQERARLDEQIIPKRDLLDAKNKLIAAQTLLREQERARIDEQTTPKKDLLAQEYLQVKAEENYKEALRTRINALITPKNDLFIAQKAELDAKKTLAENEKTVFDYLNPKEDAKLLIQKGKLAQDILTKGNQGTSVISKKTLLSEEKLLSDAKASELNTLRSYKSAIYEANRTLKSAQRAMANRQVAAINENNQIEEVKALKDAVFGFAVGGGDSPDSVIATGTTSLESVFLTKIGLISTAASAVLADYQNV